MTRGTFGVAAALTLVTALAGCGSDEAVRENTSALRATGSLLTGAVLGRRAAAAPGGLPVIERRSIDTSPNPVRVITVEKVGASGVIVPLSQNGDVTVFTSADGILFAMRNDVLIATRGLPVDLMSAAAPSAETLRRGTGTHGRAYFTLTGIDETRRVDFRCSLATAGRETLAIYGLSVPVTVIVESCTAPGTTIENRYWFDNRGRVRQSRQWINASLGYLGVIDPMR
jgi:hypothetical protein